MLDMRSVQNYNRENQRRGDMKELSMVLLIEEIRERRAVVKELEKECKVMEDDLKKRIEDLASAGDPNIRVDGSSVRFGECRVTTSEIITLTAGEERLREVLGNRFSEIVRMEPKLIDKEKLKELVSTSSLRVSRLITETYSTSYRKELYV